MPAALPSALRARFQQYIEEGLSGRAAAARLKISAATGVRWQRKLRETGSIEPELQGRPRGHGKLAPHREFLEELVAQDSDITLPELAGALEAATGGIVHAASIGRFLRKLGYTYKKIVDRNRALSYSGDASASGLVPAPHPGHAGAASSSCVH